MPRIKIYRKQLFALVELKYESKKNGDPLYACTTMDRDIKASDPRVQEFKRRVLQRPKAKTDDKKK